MPAQSPRARLKHSPRTIPVSSIVWCWSTLRSPLMLPERSKRPCLQNELSMWPKNPIGLLTVHSPVPSRFSVNEICVSFVFLSIVAVRIINLLVKCRLWQNASPRPRIRHMRSPKAQTSESGTCTSAFSHLTLQSAQICASPNKLNKPYGSTFLKSYSRISVAPSSLRRGKSVGTSPLETAIFIA